MFTSLHDLTAADDNGHDRDLDVATHTAKAVTDAADLLIVDDDEVDEYRRAVAYRFNNVPADVLRGHGIDNDDVRYRAYVNALKLAGLTVYSHDHFGDMIDRAVRGGTLVTVHAVGTAAIRRAQSLFDAGFTSTSLKRDPVDLDALDLDADVEVIDGEVGLSAAWAFIVPVGADDVPEGWHRVGDEPNLTVAVNDVMVDELVNGGNLNYEQVNGDHTHTGHVDLAPAAVLDALGLPALAGGDRSVDDFDDLDDEERQKADEKKATDTRAAIHAAYMQLVTAHVASAYDLDPAKYDARPRRFDRTVSNLDRETNRARERLVERVKAIEEEVVKQDNAERAKARRAGAGLKTTAATLAPVTADEVDDLTIVPHVLAAGSLTLLTGPYGAGKSSVMLELARTVATPGHAFAGRFPAAHTGRVLLLDAENDGVDLRFSLKALGVEPNNPHLTVIAADRFVNRVDPAGNTVTVSIVDMLAAAVTGDENAADDLVDALTADGGPYRLVMLDGFKKVLDRAGVSERQEGEAGRLLDRWRELANRLTGPHATTSVVSTHTTQSNDAVTSGVVLDRYAGIIVRLRTSAKPGHTIKPTDRRTLESGKRADRAGGELPRTVLDAKRNGVRLTLTLDDEPYSPRRAKADPAPAEDQAPDDTPVDLRAAILDAVPDAGEPGVGRRPLAVAVADVASTSRRAVEEVVDEMVADGVLTDEAPAPAGPGRKTGQFYART